MNNKKEKKKIIITGQIMLRIIAVLSIVTAVVFAITELIRGTPILEIFMENLVIWGGVAIPVFVVFFLFGDEKKRKEGESEIGKEEK